MCLYVYKSSMIKPIPVKKAFKMLRVRGNWQQTGITTTYQDNLVPFGDGHFVASDYEQQNREYSFGTTIYGGYLHSGVNRRSEADHQSKKLLRTTSAYEHLADVCFPAFAFDVCAVGDDADMISRGLYIPAMDLRNYSSVEAQKLRQMYPRSFTAHTEAILKVLGRKF